MSKTQMHTVKPPSNFMLNILILVSLPMILDFHNLSTALKLTWLFQSSLYILFSASCSVTHTLVFRYANSSASSTGPFVKLFAKSVVTLIILLLSLLGLILAEVNETYEFFPEHLYVTDRQTHMYTRDVLIHSSIRLCYYTEREI